MTKSAGGFFGLRSVEVFGQRKMLPCDTAAIELDVRDSGPTFGIYPRTGRVSLGYRIIITLVLSHANTGVLRFQQYFGVEIPYGQKPSLLGAEGENVCKDEARRLQSILPALINQLETDFIAGRVTMQKLKTVFRKLHSRKAILKLSASG